MHNQQVVTGDDGRFAFPAQCERFALLAVHGSGYAERTGDADQRSGDLTLQPWARVQGRLLQAGKPVPDVWIIFQPLRLLGPGRPHVQQDLSGGDRPRRPVRLPARAADQGEPAGPALRLPGIAADLQPGGAARPPARADGRGRASAARARWSGAGSCSRATRPPRSTSPSRSPGCSAAPRHRAAGRDPGPRVHDRTRLETMWTASQEG